MAEDAQAELERLRAEKLLDLADDIRAFIKAHDSQLKTKDAG